MPRLVLVTCSALRSRAVPCSKISREMSGAKASAKEPPRACARARRQDLPLVADAAAGREVSRFARHRKVGLCADLTAIEVHHSYRTVKACYPNLVERYSGSPADSIDAHAGKANDWRRKRSSVGSELDRATADAVDHARLRTGQPVLSAPNVAMDIRTQFAGAINSATREFQDLCEPWSGCPTRCTGPFTRCAGSRPVSVVVRACPSP